MGRLLERIRVFSLPTGNAKLNHMNMRLSDILKTTILIGLLLALALAMSMGEPRQSPSERVEYYRQQWIICSTESMEPFAWKPSFCENAEKEYIEAIEEERNK